LNITSVIRQSVNQSTTFISNNYWAHMTDNLCTLSLRAIGIRVYAASFVFFVLANTSSID